MVVVVGPNGCGKSSLFDALSHWYRMNTGFGINGDDKYYRKLLDQDFQWNQTVTVGLHGGAAPQRDGFYMRTAYRNDPDFAISGFSRPGNPPDSPRISRAIDNDQAVSDNYQRLVYDTMSGVYDADNDSKTVLALREELIGAVRASMERVFGDLILNSISDPLNAGSFFFQKGTVQSYHYKNLSGGEKAAFDLLLDLLIKKRYFTNAIYCIDELDVHLHTRVQGVLLKEMVRVLPGESQLWVTTHSLGVLRAALDLLVDVPGSVCLIDFDGVDPDQTRELMPVSLGRAAWEKLLSITLDDLSPRVAPRIVVVCEGSSVGNRRRDFDASVYNRVFSELLAEVVFISGGSANQVASGVSVRDLLKQLLPSTRIVGLVDRDDLSGAEVEAMEAGGATVVLPRRNLESYLLADDVLEALAAREGRADLLAEVIQIKTEALRRSTVDRRNPADDLKSAAGEIYTGVKQLLGLMGSGNNSDAFLRDTLAPLVQPGLATYEELKNAVVDRLS